MLEYTTVFRNALNIPPRIPIIIMGEKIETNGPTFGKISENMPGISLREKFRGRLISKES